MKRSSILVWATAVVMLAPASSLAEDVTPAFAGDRLFVLGFSFTTFGSIVAVSLSPTRGLTAVLGSPFPVDSAVYRLAAQPAVASGADESVRGLKIGRDGLLSERPASPSRYPQRPASDRSREAGITCDQQAARLVGTTIDGDEFAGADRVEPVECS